MSHMFAFVLKDRTYGRDLVPLCETLLTYIDILDLSHLEEPTVAQDAIDELVLRPEKNKDIIKAIARTYTESKSQEDLFSIDFIRGKGEGQIFLLHGPPGTGKTLTAGKF
jgi:Cdc6-like AAA superfamily ATPase